MKELILEIITTYENRISTVEEVIGTAYQTTVASQGSLGIADEERKRLIANLQKLLARNCSLRKKDFNHLVQGVLSSSDRKRREIEEDRDNVRQKVAEYLAEQKALVNLLREQLLRVTQGNGDGDGLEAASGKVRSLCQDAGQHLFALLHNHQLQLGAYQKEQEEVNGKLQRLVDRGQSLTIEDLRQVEAVKVRRERKADRELRREDVERLLLHFKQQRQDSHHWRQ